MRRFAPRIRTVFLIVNLVILLLPLFGIQALRLYESELIRQTESGLIAQGVYIREHYKAELLGVLHRGAKSKAEIAAYGNPIDAKFLPLPDMQKERYAPIQAELEIARERIRSRAEDGIFLPNLPDSAALRVGDVMSPILRRTQRFSLSGVRVVDFRGMVVATTSGELGLSLAHREEVQRALRGETISLLRERVSDSPPAEVSGISRSGMVRVFLGLPVTHEGRVLGAVVLSRTPMDIQKALYLNRFVLMRYITGLLLIVLAVSLLTAVTVTRPLGALIAQTRRVKENVWSDTEPLAHPGSHEIRELSRAIADMAKTLRARADYIEAFAKNVSHEFKTPLAAIHAIVEIFRDHMGTMSKEEQTRFLDMLSSDATRMQKLVEKLLVLARADVAAPAVDTADPEAVLKSVTQRYQELGLNVDLSFTDDRKLPGLRIAAVTLDSLLANLLENARQHGGTAVHVEIRARLVSPAAIEITVSDDGPGVSEANQAKVFTPFFTTAREAGGTGLGLSIVRSLAEAHGGDIKLISPRLELGRGVTVTLRLPIA